VIQEYTLERDGIYVLVVTPGVFEFIMAQLAKRSDPGAECKAVGNAMPAVAGSTEPVAPKADRSEKAARPPSPKTWIFQSSPARYDLRGALRVLKEHVWPVSRFAKEIKPGDQVYFWEAGSKAAIIALAEVIEAPFIQAESKEQLAFIRNTETFAGIRMRVKVRVLRSMDPGIQKRYLQSRLEFADLSILRNPRGTNFQVSREEAEFLAKACAIFHPAARNSDSVEKRRIGFVQG
jgi:EVE domain